MKNILLKAPDSDITPQNWARPILALLQDRVRQGEKNWQLTLVVENFSPADIHFYHFLQNEIAKIIPIEAERPTIHIKIRGHNKIGEKPRFVFLGGTGPLSDAQMTSDVMHQLKQNEASLDNISVDLFSSPPPRALAPPLQKFHYIKSYLKFIKNNSRAEFYMLSNTAHLNLSKLKYLVKKGLKGKKSSNVHNMVKHIAKKLSQDLSYKPESDENLVFVLGTQSALLGKLYPDAFAQYKIPSIMPPSQEWRNLQDFIDLVKQGKTNAMMHGSQDQTVGFMFVAWLLDQLGRVIQEQKQMPTQLLLGCTELPLLLKEKIPENCQVSHGITTYQDFFLSECNKRWGKVPHLIDTEVQMSRYIVNNISSVKQQADASKQQQQPLQKPSRIFRPSATNLHSQVIPNAILENPHAKDMSVSFKKKRDVTPSQEKDHSKKLRK